MTSFRQLYDPGTGTHYLLDTKALVFKVYSDEVNKETRLKPHFLQILAALFSGHPQPVSYKEITNILKCNQLACPDETRLHRKASELRIFLAKFHPGLDHLICNTRGIGYSLPLHFKDPEINELSYNYKISNKQIQDVLSCFEEYAKKSIELSKRCNITKSEDGFILQRKPAHAELEHLLDHYDKQKKKLYAELRLHPVDFVYIRLEFILAKLKTYLGLARVSEFSITKEQWLEWHDIELRQTLNELIHNIKQTDAIKEH
jgi:DNA-binding winged helix-turn-helix (wHTH) protein